MLNLVYKGDSGRIVHGDNLVVLSKLPDNFAHSCISDFPYGIDFLGKKWDAGGKGFYDWCFARGAALVRVMKPGGFVAIFGHPKQNHRMKSAFEDAGFNIVEEINWVYVSAMPKSQDIGKLFDKAAGVERPVIGVDEKKLRPNRKPQKDGGERVLAGGFSSDNGATITAPVTDLAKQWDGWRTAGLKPAHEPITIFQKPLEGTYIQNIEKHGCGGFNIPACKVKSPDEDRFPMNVIFDEDASELLDFESGESLSRLFPVIYNKKVSQSERKLSDGSRNPHVTLKPVALIQWLVRLLTPLSGVTIDITAGSCTHAVACERLNREEGYKLTWLDIELQNTDDEPYCDVGRRRVEETD